MTAARGVGCTSAPHKEAPLTVSLSLPLTLFLSFFLSLAHLVDAQVVHQAGEDGLPPQRGRLVHDGRMKLGIICNSQDLEKN